MTFRRLATDPLIVVLTFVVLLLAAARGPEVLASTMACIGAIGLLAHVLISNGME